MLAGDATPVIDPFLEILSCAAAANDAGKRGIADQVGARGAGDGNRTRVASLED